MFRCHAIPLFGFLCLFLGVTGVGGTNIALALLAIGSMIIIIYLSYLLYLLLR